MISSFFLFSFQLFELIMSFSMMFGYAEHGEEFYHQNICFNCAESTRAIQRASTSKQDLTQCNVNL